MALQNLAGFSSETSRITFLLLSMLALSSLPKQRTLVEATSINHLRAQYPPISDAWLRTLLGYSDEEDLPNGILLNQKQPINVDNEEINHWKSNQEIGGGAPMQFFVSKRKNAELVNHILKNFASINRLGDAGK
uniref:Uncharacterized protein n=1 Tax=Meloidogyne hapla TaxID=6305 RepID=A0A1I8BG63_MELHA